MCVAPISWRATGDGEGKLRHSESAHGEGSHIRIDRALRC
jgi:hypothetical protein